MHLLFPPFIFQKFLFFLLPGYSILVDMRAVCIPARIEKKYEAQVFLTCITESRAIASFQLSLGAVTIRFLEGQILIKRESTCHCSLDVSSSGRLARLHFWSCSPRNFIVVNDRYIGHVIFLLKV